jgi:hypothetical protein
MEHVNRALGEGRAQAQAYFWGLKYFLNQAQRFFNFQLFLFEFSHNTEAI